MSCLIMCVQDYASIDPKVWGPHFWYVFQSMAHNYPLVPSQSDKETYRLTFNNLLNYMPNCDKGCHTHANEYIKKNPMALDSRNSLVDWTSSFQSSQTPNNTNICNDGSCQLKTVNDSSQENSLEEEAVDITKALKKSKQAKKELFLALCRKYKVPEPKDFRFEVCPTNASTSCIAYEEDNIPEATPYLNPYSDSDKQVIHEFQHYKSLVQSGAISDEKSAETFAYTTIAKAYPTSIPEGYQQSQTQPTQPNKEIQPTEQSTPNEESSQSQEIGEKTQSANKLEAVPTSKQEIFDAWDSSNEYDIKALQKTPQESQSETQGEKQSFDESTPDIANVSLIRSSQPKAKKKLSKWDKTIEDIVSNSSVAVGSIDDSLEGDTSAGYAERFPNYARAVREANMAKKEQEITKKLNEGFISYLDPVYQFPAKVLGLKAGHMNLAHTPEIIMNVVQTLIESNTTPIGSGLFAFLTGVSLFIVGYLGKASISFRDQLALQNISAAFLWRTMQYINPKYELKKDLKKMYQKIQDGDFRLSDSFIETPGQWKKKQNKMKNAWTTMPHYLGKDEKGRPAFIIPAPAAFATMGMGAPGAPMAGGVGLGTGSSSEFTMPIHQNDLIGGLNLSAHQSDSPGEPMYTLGSGYYEIGNDPFDFDQSGGMVPMAGSIGAINPDVLQSVTTIGM